jgi:hypothetical protein
MHGEKSGERYEHRGEAAAWTEESDKYHEGLSLASFLGI